MGIEGIGFQLDDGHGHIGAVVGHALVVGQQVVEHKALIQRAGAGLQPIHMVGLHLVAQAVDDLLQRLHPRGALGIVVHEGADGDVQNLLHGGLHHVQLVAGLRRELQVLVVYLLGRLGDVQRVVGDTLEIGDGMQELADLLALRLGQRLAGDLHQIGAQLILVAVDDGFRLRHLPEILVGKPAAQGHSHQQIPLCPLRHGVRHQAALLDGQRRVLQKALLQPIHVLLLRMRAGIREQRLHQPLHQPDARQQHDDRSQAEQGVHQGDGHRGHDGTHECKVHDGVDAVEQQRPDQHAQHVDQQIDERRALAVQIGAQRAQQHRHGGADGDTHDDGQRDLEGDGAGDGQRLQNAHCGGRALEDAGEYHAHQNAQNGVGKAGQDADKSFALPQGRHRAGHGGHAVHQHGKAQQDLAHMPVGRLAVEHPQDNADHRHHAGEHLRAQQLHHAAAALQRGQAQDPPGDAGAHDGAHNDADGLPHLHHTGVHEAHHHHGGGGGGLDHGGDAGTQQNALQRRAAELVQHQLQPAAGHLLQPLAHQGHAEQEQRDTAKQCDHVCDAHSPFPPMIILTNR